MGVIIPIVSFILILRAFVMSTESELSIFAAGNLADLIKSFHLLSIDLKLNPANFSKDMMYKLYCLCVDFIEYYKDNYNKFV